MVRDRQARKRQIIDAICALTVTNTIYDVGHHHPSELAARAAYLHALLADLKGNDTSLIIEQDDGLVRHDNQWLIEATRATGQRNTLRYEHQVRSAYRVESGLELAHQVPGRKPACVLPVGLGEPRITEAASLLMTIGWIDRALGHLDRATEMDPSDHLRGQAAYLEAQARARPSNDLDPEIADEMLPDASDLCEWGATDWGEQDMARLRLEEARALSPRCTPTGGSV